MQLHVIIFASSSRYGAWNEEIQFLRQNHIDQFLLEDFLILIEIWSAESKMSLCLCDTFNYISFEAWKCFVKLTLFLHDFCILSL